MKWFERLAAKRAPDFVIGGKNDPYMERWWLIPRNPVFNIYLHRFWRSDDDRALHDHPWFNISILLQGTYVEHTIAAGGVHHQKRYYTGDFKLRSPWAAHRIEIDDSNARCGYVWSLFITGPIIRTWGFHCPAGWRPWTLFVSERDKGSIGRGCE